MIQTRAEGSPLSMGSTSQLLNVIAANLFLSNVVRSIRNGLLLCCGCLFQDL